MVKINGTQVYPELNYEFIDNGTEEFDLGQMIFTNSTDRDLFNEWDTVELTEENAEGIISAYETNWIANGLWEHRVTISEPVIKLSTVPHENRYFTTVGGSKTTYLYHLQTILANIEYGKTSPYTIATATQTLLNVTADEKEYVGGDLLETVKEIMRTQNARPTLTNTNEIGHEPLNKRGSLVSFTNQEHEKITRNISDYALRVHSKLKNATYEADLIAGGTYYPSSGGAITPRVPEDQEKYSDDNAIWILDSGIRRMIDVRGVNITTSTLGTITNLLIPIVSKEEWDGLTIERDSTLVYQGDYKNNTMYYVEGDNHVQNVGTRYDYDGLYLGPKQAVQQAIRRALYVLYSTDTEFVAQTIRTIQLRFYYQPIRDIDVTQERHNLARVTKKTTITNPQKDSVIELSRLGNANKSLINRIGNDDYEFTVNYKNGATPFNKGDYNSNGYAIVKRHFKHRPSNFDVTYYVSKEKTVLDPIANISRSISPYTILKKSILTNFIYQEYIEFSGTQRTDTTDNSQVLREILLNALIFSSAQDTPMYICQYTRDSSTYLELSVQSVPMGNTFIFNAQFTSPKIAGYQLVNDSIGYKMTPIAYTDDNGEVAAARFFFRNTGTTSSTTHPVGTFTAAYRLQIPIVNIKLNPNEILGITYALHCVSDNPNLIIGDYFLQNNSLIKELGVSQNYTVVYYNECPYYDTHDKYAINPTDGSASLTVDTTNYAYFDVNVSSGQSWAIVETASPYRLYMAYNNTGTDLTRVYMNMLKNRTNVETL